MKQQAICELCMQAFEKRSANQKYCTECGVEMRKQQHRELLKNSKFKKIAARNYNKLDTLEETGEKAFENDANLSIPKLRYFCTCGDKVVSNCVFRLSHIKKISRIKIKLKVVDEVKLSKWVKKKDRKVGEAEAYCLTCGREVVYQVINNRYQFENYCPHCGARMDLER